MKPQGADEHILKLKAFPFSLADKAKQWLYELPSGRITSWGDMMKEFLEKYFPTSRIIMLRKKISGIQQGQDESYAEYYERFKSLITQCPQHGMKDETLLTCFYDGLTPLERDMLDAASGGSFVDKEPAAGMILIENRALNQQQYGNSRSKITTTRERVHEVSTLAQLEEKINKLTTLVSQGAQGQVMVCGVCSMQGHVSDQCPQLMEGGGQEGVNAIGFQQGFQRPRNDPFSNTYNPGWRDHPNFRWKDNDNVQNAPQGFQQRPQGFYQKSQPPNPTPFNSNFNSNASSSSNDELIRTLTKSTQALIAGQTHHGNQINAISTDVNEMKKQMSQVVEFMGKFHEQGKLPSGTIPNPHFEQAKVVTTRSGKTLVDLPKPPKKNSTSTLEEEEDPATSKAQVTSPPSNAKPKPQGQVSNSFISVIANPSSSPLPFPSRFARSKQDDAEKAILETFKKVQINIPLLEAIKQIPKYAKFLKELCTTRRQNREKEVVRVSENVSAVLQRRMPEKCKDPGSFSIPCVIGTSRFENAMLDLGASINVMPYSVYETLGLGELKHDNVIIQLADRSNAYPKGLVEDVLVQVGELIFPAGFYVLEMEESPKSGTPLLLGRPFMRTARTKIDVYSGSLTMEFDGEIVGFNIFEAMRYPLVDFSSCFSIDILDELAQKFMEMMDEDTLASTIANGVGIFRMTQPSLRRSSRPFIVIP
ncbi:uncharacterized protein LOC133716297 [Rosa rugosa]|uniref:uncharacterized protein LOC133716297 n=1 Tax=Rosa rugosa TaxID=74645 RepID=UPI002B406712|nr:uncharacterized protein LOC133716297 [Rosa rugosa]